MTKQKELEMRLAEIRKRNQERKDPVWYSNLRVVVTDDLQMLNGRGSKVINGRAN